MPRRRLIPMVALLAAHTACSLAPSDAPPVTPPADPVVAAMQARPLVPTRHGACRIACRGIDDAEVRAILRDGTLRPERTRHEGPCPSHALEGRTADGQDVRVVFAACADETRIVTAIDLGAEHDCDCP